MSKIDFIGNENGSGTITVTAPNTATDRVITAGDQTGNTVVSDGSLLTVDYTSNRVTMGGSVDLTQADVNGAGAITIQNSNNVTLGTGQIVHANSQAGALTLTLPASANIGDTIVVQDSGFASSNNITIARNSHNIDGAARNVIINTDFGGVSLVYESSRNGWLTEKIERESVKGFPGEVAGYITGGEPPLGLSSSIEKFPFASDNNAVSQTAVLSVGRSLSAGQSSQTHGYVSGGEDGTPGAAGYTTQVDKFSFISDVNATVVGNLTQGRKGPTGQSSPTHGYSSGGLKTPPTAASNVIDRFPFSSDVDATDAGDMSVGRQYPSGQSSEINGYVSSGVSAYPTAPGANSTVIDKFPFATFTTATDIGNLITGTGALFSAGQSSATHGYMSGGDPVPGPPSTVSIQKWPFATDGDSTDVGDLTQTREQLAGQSSTISGYNSGGMIDPASFYDTIDKFPFASDANATDVGNLTGVNRQGAGHQV
jgi:hypothetical protein